MPYKSKSQMRFLFAAEARNEVPKGTARRWAHHTPSIKKLPEHVSDKKDKGKEKKGCQLPRLLRKLAEDSGQGPPPNYRPSTSPVSKCATCKDYSAQNSTCARFQNTPVSSLGVCDAWTPRNNLASSVKLDPPDVHMPDLSFTSSGSDSGFGNKKAHHNWVSKLAAGAAGTLGMPIPELKPLAPPGMGKAGPVMSAHKAPVIPSQPLQAPGRSQDVQSQQAQQSQPGLPGQPSPVSGAPHSLAATLGEPSITTMLMKKTDEALRRPPLQPVQPAQPKMARALPRLLKKADGAYNPLFGFNPYHSGRGGTGGVPGTPQQAQQPQQPQQQGDPRERMLAQEDQRINRAIQQRMNMLQRGQITPEVFKWYVNDMNKRRDFLRENLQLQSQPQQAEQSGSMPTPGGPESAKPTPGLDIDVEKTTPQDIQKHYATQQRQLLNNLANGRMTRAQYDSQVRSLQSEKQQRLANYQFGRQELGLPEVLSKAPAEGDAPGTAGTSKGPGPDTEAAASKGPGGPPPEPGAAASRGPGPDGAAAESKRLEGPTEEDRKGFETYQGALKRYNEIAALKQEMDEMTKMYNSGTLNPTQREYLSRQLVQREQDYKKREGEMNSLKGYLDENASNPYFTGRQQAYQQAEEAKQPADKLRQEAQERWYNLYPKDPRTQARNAFTQAQSALTPVQKRMDEIAAREKEVGGWENLSPQEKDEYNNQLAPKFRELAPKFNEASQAHTPLEDALLAQNHPAYAQAYQNYQKAFQAAQNYQVSTGGGKGATGPGDYTAELGTAKLPNWGLSTSEGKEIGINRWEGTPPGMGPGVAKGPGFTPTSPPAVATTSAAPGTAPTTTAPGASPTPTTTGSGAPTPAPSAPGTPATPTPPAPGVAKAPTTEAVPGATPKPPGGMLSSPGALARGIGGSVGKLPGVPKLAMSCTVRLPPKKRKKKTLLRRKRAGESLFLETLAQKSAQSLVGQPVPVVPRSGLAETARQALLYVRSG